MKEKLQAFFHNNPKRAYATVAAACLVLVVCVAVVALSVGGGDGDGTSSPSDVQSTEQPFVWSEQSLLDGIPEPDEGTVVAVNLTERSVAVFFEAFPPEALREYLAETGLTFTGTAPYVAQTDGRTVAVEYSASDEKLSVTVVAD